MQSRKSGKLPCKRNQQAHPILLEAGRGSGESCSRGWLCAEDQEESHRGQSREQAGEGGQGRESGCFSQDRK